MVRNRLYHPVSVRVPVQIAPVSKDNIPLFDLIVAVICPLHMTCRSKEYQYGPYRPSVLSPSLPSFLSSIARLIHRIVTYRPSSLPASSRG